MRRRPGANTITAVAMLLAALSAAAAIVVLGFPRQRGAATETGAITSQPATTGRRAPPKPAGPHNSPVPILMYHVIAAAPAGARYPDLYVSPGDFSAEVAMLAREGFHAVTLGRVYRYWQGTEAIPAKPVVFSFDDGYRSVFENAFPILRARDWPGVVNMVVKNMRVSWGLRPRLLKELIASGWEVDAHSISHPNLTTLDDAALAREVTGSRAQLEQVLHAPVDFFCYPVGRYDSRVIGAVEAAGFLGAMTENPGLASPDELFELARVRVRGSDDAASLAARLEALGEP